MVARTQISERKPRSLKEWLGTFFDGLLDRLPVL
jgi:hypothetical protein